MQNSLKQIMPLGMSLLGKLRAYFPLGLRRSELACRCVCGFSSHEARNVLSSSRVLGAQTAMMSTKGNENDIANPRVRGIDVLRDPTLNKGTAFTLEERQVLGIDGLLPPAIFSQDEQAERILANIRRWDKGLDKYIYLSGLLDRNERLFYRIVMDNIEELAPIIYTPTVGQACQEYGFIFRKARGLFITINDIGHVYNILGNWPEKDVKAIVVTDGERILGLGDLGSNGMGIPVGKLSLYTAMGGMHPKHVLPIVLDVGTNNEQLLNNPSYIGLRHKRVRGDKYDQLVDEFLEAVVQRFGRCTLIQFEDFANANAFRFLEKYRQKYLTFNDDIQGTASVALAGVISSMKILKTKLSDHKYLFQGAGEASIGIAQLLVMAMIEEGCDEAEAHSKIWLVDSRGLIVKNRSSGGINEHKEQFAQDYREIESLEEICAAIKPTIAIGAAAISGAFTEPFLKLMASFNDRPIIFALSNPTSKAECTAEEAYHHTEGRCVFASGSPFDPVTYNGKTFYPGQGNNAYIFPGVALGVLLAGSHHVTDLMFLRASQTLANMVTKEDLDNGRVYPPLSNIQEVSTHLAASIIKHAYSNGMASTYPEPEDKVAFVRSYQYSPSYQNFVPHRYSWPNAQ